MSTCPICGELDLPARSRFCFACGRAVDGSDEPHSYTPPHLTREVLTTRSAREGEHKEVTVLFADIADSLAMAEALDPEQIHDIMDGFFGGALDAVHAEHGTINQFRGDGLMALFGAPRAFGDEAARGLRAALGIRLATERYSRSVESRFGIPILLRLGLHTGTVWVGSVGNELRRDYTAEGPTVGLAARLERAANPGQILVSEAMVRRVGALFEFKELGTQRFKGVSRPVRVFDLTGRGPFVDRFDAERAHGLGRLVGRERELDQLERLVQPDGPPLVVLWGEAGIGKSRLLHEFLTRRAGLGQVALARCREADALRAYAPWLELLRARPFGALESERLARRLVGGPGSERPGLAAEIAEAVASAARRTPLVLAFEDIQWIDPSSREVLRALCEQRPPQATLLATSRVAGGSDPPLAAEAIELSALDPRAARALAAGVLGSADDAEPLAALAARRGAGNPLFVEEVARALRDADRETRRVARLELEVLASGSRVPETLTGVIAARIDALPDPAKRALQAAAAIGRPFDSELLARTEPDRRADPAARLGTLVERGLLLRDASGGFEFRHVLVREVAYSQLLDGRRRALHRRCAAALERRGVAETPDGASLLGSHYDQAGMASAAREHLAAAGRAYLALGAPHEAASHLQRAWELENSAAPAQAAGRGDTAVRTRLGLALASALNTLDRAGEAEAILEQLRPDGLDADDRRRLALSLIAGGWVRFSERADPAGGRAMIERGLRLVAGLASGERAALTGLAHLVRIHTQEGETEAAVARADELFERACDAGDRFLQAFARSARGSALCDRGDSGPAVAACLEATQLAAGSEAACAMAEAWLAQAYVCANRPEDALAAAGRARRAAEHTDQVGALYHAATWSGEALLLLGEHERAAAEFERLAEINDRWPSTAYRRARGLLATGQVRLAAEMARTCLDARPTRVTRARALCTLGLALGLSESNARREALQLLSESEELCTELGLRPYLVDAKRAQARLCEHWGDDVAASRHRAELKCLLSPG